MDVGIGLPATIPGVTGEQLLEWARRAEGRGFSSLGTLDRLVYGNYEPLIALSAAAGVTDRIRLTTAIMIAPYRANAALVAKQAATLNHLSNGRLVFGVAVGGREDDYEASGVDFHKRGKLFEEMLAEWAEIWAGKRGIGPVSKPTLIIGGTADVAFERAARYGEGWIMGGGPADRFAGMVEQLEAAWTKVGREGSPSKLALGYFSLGEGAQDAANAYLRDYYGFLGEYADQIASGALTDAEAVRERVKAFEDAGCDELILFPSSPDPDQVDLLAEALSG